MVLEEVGIKADTCTSGQEALRKMEVSMQKAALQYGSYGLEYAGNERTGKHLPRSIKLYEKECTVVAMTAYSWDDIQEEANSVGVNNLSESLFCGNYL